MPSKNLIKNFSENNFYHVYNRGVEKRDIFIDQQDCLVFLHYLKLYLSPLSEIQQLVKEGSAKLRFLNQNLSQEVDLIAYALMPNHFHMLLRQNTKDGIPKLMRRASTAYVMYFNKKYERVGRLFQNIYKCGLVNTDEYLTHLSRYIHLNAWNLETPLNFKNFSSYKYFTNVYQVSWVKPSLILQYFSESFTYQNFVETYKIDSRKVLGDLTLED